MKNPIKKSELTGIGDWPLIVRKVCARMGKRNYLCFPRSKKLYSFTKYLNGL